MTVYISTNINKNEIGYNNQHHDIIQYEQSLQAKFNNYYENNKSQTEISDEISDETSVMTSSDNNDDIKEYNVLTIYSSI